jgi:hypothetical protein
VDVERRGAGLTPGPPSFMHRDENRRAVFLTSSPVFWGRMEVGVERRSAGGLFSALPRPDFFSMRAPM